MFELRPYRKSSVSYYNPFREMADLERSFWGDPDSRNALAEFKTDITDEGDHFLLEADMPGFDKKDRYVCSERSYGSYSRSFDITGIDAAGIRARYANGVLSLTLPKKAAMQPERTSVEIE